MYVFGEGVASPMVEKRKQIKRTLELLQVVGLVYSRQRYSNKRMVLVLIHVRSNNY